MVSRLRVALENIEETGWVGFDLDKTIAYYDSEKAFDPLYIGPPIPDMIKLIHEYLEAGRDVRIFTARVAEPNPQINEIRQTIVDWCKKYIGKELPITNEKDPSMWRVYDDLAKEVIPNTGKLI